MNTRLHQRARTTPAVREDIQRVPLSERKLARKRGVLRATIRKWKGRDSAVFYQASVAMFLAVLEPAFGPEKHAA